MEKINYYNGVKYDENHHFLGYTNCHLSYKDCSIIVDYEGLYIHDTPKKMVSCLVLHNNIQRVLNVKRDPFGKIDLLDLLWKIDVTILNL